MAAELEPYFMVRGPPLVPIFSDRTILFGVRSSPCWSAYLADDTRTLDAETQCDRCEYQDEANQVGIADRTKSDTRIAFDPDRARMIGSASEELG